MKQKSTKDTILYTLKKHKELSMKQLMNHFTISDAAVRKHLQELLRLGFIEERIVKKDIGRPYNMYKLTEKGHLTFPNQYATLPVELIKDLEQSQGTEAVHGLFTARKEREKGLLKQVTDVQSFKKKVKRLMEHQEENGYMLEMVEHDNGDIEMINYNCPIFNLATQYHSICSNEHDIYRDIFPDSEVVSHKTLAKDRQYCKWTITNPDKT